MNSERVERIRKKLSAAFNPDVLEVIDDSARHAGHAGASTGLGHFQVKISSASFAGVSPLQRHRMVYQVLAEMLKTDIHALNIQASAPD